MNDETVNQIHEKRKTLMEEQKIDSILFKIFKNLMSAVCIIFLTNLYIYHTIEFIFYTMENTLIFPLICLKSRNQAFIHVKWLSSGH